ncbi:MAG: CDP-glycerol glycerophosphotransferase family protein, partial [Clostridia bacterium]|nr:CDP-glycerol glycerophosphotransferase family protein [Clostridia bacterium]
MFKRYLNKFKKVKGNIEPRYIKYCQLPIDEKLVLVEGGQGSNINGNMFAMLKELQTNPRWKEYKTVFVVTENTLEKAEARMRFYGFSNVILSCRNSKSYCKYLATAKYIMTDNTFPPYFNKRDEQVFLNTWHGTPLKTLGKSNKSSLSSLANVQKNYLMSDYALFPNEFTREVFMKDYDLRNIFTGKSLIANYPRNYIFYDAVSGENMKKTLGYEGKKVFAYMPTWRDASTKKQKEEQLLKTEEILREFDEKLDDSSVLLVNLHFLLASEINCDDFKHVHYFSNDYDTYEILNACDGLITDYSSVFFDYAVTGKKVVLFAYDKEDYLSSRGLYMPF